MRRFLGTPRIQETASAQVDLTSRGRQLALLCLLASVLASGCCHLPGGRCRDWWRNGFKVGPDYCPPAAPVASQWIDYEDPRVKSEEQQLTHWWTVFNDPVLNSLIQTAYQQNLTLRAAGARILEARAL